MTITDLVAELSTAIVDAHEVARERIRHHQVDSHFVENEDGELVASTVRAVVGGREVEVPKILLHRKRSLDMKRFRIGLETDIDVSRGTSASGPKARATSVRVGLRRGLLSRATHATIEMEFETDDPAEGLSLLEDRLNQELRNELYGRGGS